MPLYTSDYIDAEWEHEGFEVGIAKLNDGAFWIIPLSVKDDDKMADIGPSPTLEAALVVIALS